MEKSIAPADILGSEWTLRGSVPYRARHARLNVLTQVHEVGLKRLDTGDDPGVGYEWLDPAELVACEHGWRPSNEDAEKLVEEWRKSAVERIELLGENVTKVMLNHEAEWHHSEFPHPLVTLDFDAEDKLIGVSVVTPDA